MSSGTFSGTNAKVQPLFEKAFPELEAEAFDIATWVRTSRRLLATNAACVLAEYGPQAFIAGDRLRRSFYYTSYIFSRIAGRCGTTSPGPSICSSTIVSD